MDPKYRPLKTMAADLKELIDDLGVFNHISSAAITEYSQVQTLSKKISSSRRPAAIVCIGPGGFDKGGLLREGTLGILVLDDFHADLEDKATEVWDRLEAVSELFIPDFDENDVPLFQTIENVRYLPGEFRPVPMADGGCSAYLLEIEFSETCQYQRDLT